MVVEDRARKFVFYIMHAALVGWLLFGPFASQAIAAPSVVGTWKTIDDKTHAPKSLVETYVRGGKLYGRITKLLMTDKGPHAVCDKCDGALRGAPLEGLEIISDLVEADGSWEKGSVLDPGNGVSYRCRIRLVGNDRLEVRGFVGISLFGRTQVWERANAAAQGAAAP